MPSGRDLEVAFELADADRSGLVDEGEFLTLYKLIKKGEVKGLGKKSFFGSRKSSFRKSLDKVCDKAHRPSRCPRWRNPETPSNPLTPCTFMHGKRKRGQRN